jgi:DNA replication and repair protein RecF
VGDGHQCLVSTTHLGAFTGGWRQDCQVVTMRAGRLMPPDLQDLPTSA